MNLGPNELLYFNSQIDIAAIALGIQAGIPTVGTLGSFDEIYGQRCSPPLAILAGENADLQALCINSACPIATSSATCAAYGSNNGQGTDPASASSTPGPQSSVLAAQLSAVSTTGVGSPTSATGTATTTSISHSHDSKSTLVSSFTTSTTSSSTATAPKSTSAPSRSSLSAGAKAGIAIGAVVAALVIAGVVLFSSWRGRKQKPLEMAETTPHTGPESSAFQSHPRFELHGGSAVHELR